MRSSLTLILLGAMMACTDDVGISERGFLRVLDDRDINVSYNPISILTTADTGFIILTEKQVVTGELPQAFVLTIDETGNFISSDSLNDAFRQPIGKMMMIGNNYYFLAMQSADYQGVLATVDPQGKITSEDLLGISFPLATSQINNQLLVLSYDPQNTNMDLSLMDVDGNISGQGSYTIGAGSDIEQRVLDHFFEEDQELPFFTGVSSTGNYFFNGIYNFTFSLVFTDLGANPVGVVQGQGDFGGISAYLPLPGGSTLVGFQYQDNFFRVNANVNESGISSSINFFTAEVPELAVGATSRINRININGQDYIVIGSETEGRQVILYFYDQSDGDLVGIDQVGYINPYTLGDLIVTSENELVIIGSFFATGRFKRPFIKKFSKRELIQIVSR